MVEEDAADTAIEDTVEVSEDMVCIVVGRHLYSEGHREDVVVDREGEEGHIQEDVARIFQFFF